MSGGTDTTTVQNFPDWAVPAAQGYLNRAVDVSNLPYTPYTGQTVAGMNPYQSNAYQAIAARAGQGSPVMNAASGELQRTLSGGYLNNNPYLDQLVGQAQNDVMTRMDALSARSGSFGNSGVNETTMRGLGDVSAQIRGQDYARERGLMQSAVGMAPTIANQDYFDAQQLLGAGNAIRGFEQQNFDDTYQRWLQAQNYPRQQVQDLGQALGLRMGSSQTGPGQNGWGQALGTGLAAYSAYNGSGK